MNRNTFHVTASAELLTGHVLNARKDANLIRALTLWESAQQRHNETIYFTNMAAITPMLSIDVQERCHQELNERHHALRMAMRYVQQFLPKLEDIDYVPPDPWPDPEVITEESARAQEPD
jgi:hypothetical protein